MMSALFSTADCIFNFGNCHSTFVFSLTSQAMTLAVHMHVQRRKISKLAKSPPKRCQAVLIAVALSWRRQSRLLAAALLPTESSLPC